MRSILRQSLGRNRALATRYLQRCASYSTQSQGVDFAMTTLTNGVKVVTNPLPSHFAAMGIYIQAGSRFEDSERFRGVSHIVDRLAFKSTRQHTSLEMEEKLQELGGNYMCASSRETMMYQGSAFHGHEEEMFGLLSETVTQPIITNDELLEQLDNAAFEVYEIWQKPEIILPEIAHTTGFKGGLGNPLLCPEDKLAYITPDVIHEYRQRFYTPDRMVAAFSGIPHEQAVNIATKFLGSLPSREKGVVESVPKSVYTGGEILLPLPEPIGNLPQFHQLHVMYRGVSINDSDVYAAACLQTLLGGGGSFSAGGPGKGMYSRLYTDVLNRYGYIESCLGINHSYSDDGLFGISTSCIPTAAPYMSQVIGHQMSLLMTTGAGRLGYTEVERAKKQLRSSVLMNLESKMVELEDLGRQIQLNGKKIPASEMCDHIDALTPEDLRKVAERLLTTSKPTIVMQGDSREAFGDVGDMLQQFGVGAAH